MTTSSAALRATAALALAAALAFAVTACSSPASPATSIDPVASTATPRATPTATPGASAVPTASPIPSPRIDLDCAAIADPDTLGGLFSDPLEIRDPGVDAGAQPFSISPSYYVQTDGGLSCFWNNGKPAIPVGTTPRDRHGLKLLLIPNDGTASGFAKYQKYYSLGSTTEFNCYQNDGADCDVNALRNGYWVSLHIDGMSASATAGPKTLRKLAKPIVDDILATVAGAAAATEKWAPPASVTALPKNCGSFISASTVKSKLGISKTLSARVFGEDGGWSLEASAGKNAHERSCLWTYPDGDTAVMALDAMPGGAWALSAATPFMTAPSAPTEVDVTGLADSDAAFMRCAAHQDGCVLDLAVGGNWVEVQVASSSDTGLAKIPAMKAKLLKVGAAIVANLS